MPAVEGGSLVLEVSEILRLSDEDSLDAIVEAAVESRAVLVTSPSLAVVEGPWGPLVVSLGVGSLIFEASEGRPLLPGVVRVRRLRRREWVDGCRVRGRGEVVFLQGGGVSVDDTIIALDYKDPAAILVNGLRARHSLIPGSVKGERVIAEAHGHPVLGLLWIGNGVVRYVVHATQGEAARRLRYIAPLAGGCRRGLQ